jgi:hypothetical protein
MITDTFIEIATDKMGAAGSLVVAIVAESLTLKKKWPFVTLSAFQERASTIMRLSGALYIGMNPYVPHELREQWENYTWNDPDSQWYKESREYQEWLGFDNLDNRAQVESYDPDLNLSTGIANHIYSYRRDFDSMAVINPKEPYYLPVWQVRAQPRSIPWNLSC